ncbi:hypothetical protein Tco_0889172 [Tanacetum coccineum]
MFLNMDQLDQQLDKEEFQEIGSMAAFKTDADDRGKVDSSKALDASLVIIESNGIESQEQYTNSRSGNDTHVDDADTEPIYDEEPMAKVQTTVEINIFAKEQQHTEQPEFNNEGEVDQNTEQSLKNELRKITSNSVNTKFAKPSILGKPILHQHRNHSVSRQTTAFKSERPRFSKRWFASQVDVNNNLTKLVTPHYFPNRRESTVAKPHHMIAPSSSRYNSNDIVHNHYLEEAKKRTQEKDRNSDHSVMPSATSQSTTSKSLKPQRQMMSDHNSLDLAPQRQEMSVKNVTPGLVPQGKKASDYDKSAPVPSRQNVVPSAEKTDSSQ